VALHYAAHHPAEVMGLVLCQPAGLIAPRKGGTVKASASATAGSPAWRQAQRIQIVKPAMQAINAEIDRSLHTSEAALRAALRSLPCPILFALSRAGRVYPLNQYLSLLDPLLALAPQHRFTVFTGSFHPVWDEPDRFAQALNSFLQALLPLSQHRHAWQLSAVDWPTRTMNLWKCVHPDCPGEQVLTEGQNPNDTGRPESARDQRDG
jgi:pimeloyl-ACP methyl ester carboxylesterase